MKRFIVAMFISLICIGQFALPVNAYTLPDLSRDCSITIEMRYARRALSNALVTIYHVADTDVSSGLVEFSLKSDFSSTGIDFEEMTSSEKNLEFAGTLKTYVNRNSISGTSRRTDNNGTVTFSGLDSGIYLIVPGAYSGYRTMQPYLMILPQGGSNNSWIYDVSATPKTQIRPMDYPPGTDDPDPDPDDPYYPPPRRTDPPTSTPAPSTPPRENIGGSYIEIDDETPLGTEDLITIDDEIPLALGDLPQTGLLRWPVPVLSVSGLTLVAMGWIMLSMEKKYNED